jgi:antitoxin component YwqK of YwqJK toxin-antitoxin module
MTGPGGADKRIPDDELDFDENLNYFHNGELFTGVGYSDIPGGGLSEISYRNGLQHGAARDWYPSGMLKGEWIFRHNVRHGVSRELREDGSLISEKVYEFGILVESKEFDPAGRVAESFKISEDSPNFRRLQRFRNEWSS